MTYDRYGNWLPGSVARAAAALDGYLDAVSRLGSRDDAQAAARDQAARRRAAQLRSASEPGTITVNGWTISGSSGPSAAVPRGPRERRERRETNDAIRELLG